MRQIVKNISLVFLLTVFIGCGADQHSELMQESVLADTPTGLTDDMELVVTFAHMSRGDLKNTNGGWLQQNDDLNVYMYVAFATTAGDKTYKENFKLGNTSPFPIPEGVDPEKIFNIQQEVVVDVAKLNALGKKFEDRDAFHLRLVFFEDGFGIDNWSNDLLVGDYQDVHTMATKFRRFPGGIVIRNGEIKKSGAKIEYSVSARKKKPKAEVFDASHGRPWNVK